MEVVNFWDRYAKPSIFKRLILIILVFFQFYPTKFVFLPVATRHIISAMGMGLILFQIILRIANDKKIYISKQFFYVLVPLGVMSILSAYTLSYNGTSDTMYLYYFTTSFLMLSSGYFTMKVMYWIYKGNVTYDIVVYYCLLAVFAQLIFGMISYLNKPLVMPLLLKTEEGLLQLNSRESGRFIGLGQYFMNLGVANGFVLLLVSTILKFSKEYGIHGKIKFWITVCYILIALLGNMQARTTGICFLFSLAYLLFSSLKLNFSTLRSGLGQIVKSLLFIAVLILFVTTYFGDELQKYHTALDYGFELFNSVQSGKGAKTHSSDMLKWMLTIWPETTKTWFIGDGLYFLEGGNYYMRTDVGYARLIFYFGIFGMATYYIYQLIVAYWSFKEVFYRWKSLLFYLVLMLFLVNVKSCVDFVFYYSLFFSYNILRTKPIEIRKNLFA